MNEVFVASNGVEITVTAEREETYLLGKGGVIEGGDRRWTVCTGNSEGMDALREFFLYERDQELGRWRWPDYPDYVCYLTGHDRRVRVINERDVRTVSICESDMDISVAQDDLTKASRAYFDAHPEPKPWFNAKEGEVWLITSEGKTYPAIFQADCFRDHGGFWTKEHIKEAKRIWPVSKED